MSLDRSLKTAGSLDQHRNVLSRAERVTHLATRGRFDMASGSPLGLPKVGNRKMVAGGKSKKEAAPADAAAATPAAAAPAAGAAKGAAAPKAAAPKAGGKGKG